jgi:hypothetical protein
MMSVTLEDTFNDYGLSIWRHVENDDDMWDVISDEGRIQPQHMISKTKMVIKKCISHIQPKCIHENLKQKHYIMFGEECPICYEPILHKRSAFLTDCGHAFHYKCIMDYEYHNTINYKNFNTVCPICRQHMGYYQELKNKYFNDCNKLDQLENYNDTIQYTNPEFCSSCYKIKGFNKFCDKCLHYSGIRLITSVKRKLIFNVN